MRFVYRGIEMQTIGELFSGKKFVLIPTEEYRMFRLRCTTLEDVFEHVPVHFVDGKMVVCLCSVSCPLCADTFRVYDRFVCHVKEVQNPVTGGDAGYVYDGEDKVFVTGRAVVKALDGELGRFFTEVRGYGSWWTKVFNFFVKCKKEKSPGLDVEIARNGTGIYTEYCVRILGT